MIAAALLIFATATAPDLSLVRTVHVETDDEHVRAALEQSLPEFVQVSRDDADVVIEYNESHVPQVEELDTFEKEVNRRIEEELKRLQAPKMWKAIFYRLACQSPNFGDPPTPPIDGKCENLVYVRVTIGTLSGTADDSKGATEAFVTQFRDAAYGPR